MWQKFLDLLFPRKCIICDSADTQRDVCSNCWQKITFITKPYCVICSNPFNYEEDDQAICGHCVIKTPKYDKAISILKYDEHSKKLIHKFKYQDQLHALDYLTSLMVNMSSDIINNVDYIIPVAMHKYKLLKRVYNQAAMLAMQIAKSKKITYLPQLLIKKNNSSAQAGLKREHRLENIKNSFQINEKLKHLIKGKNILLIDDVITTGATIDECCKLLRTAGPVKIFVLTLEKTT
jgi:ComF family protein